MNKSTQTNPWHLLITASMLLLSAWMLTGCSEPELFEECVRDEECAEDEICLNLLCQPPQCDTDEIACGRDCVNPRIELEFCGGCNGCPGTDNAEGIQCLEGQCIYRCLDGFVDVNDDINDPNGDGCECIPDGPEVCDGIDNDCDGLVDAMDDDLEPCDAEDGAEAACVAGICELACTPGFVDVNEDLGTGGNGCECEPTGDEVCDGQDNDCDGLTDTEDDDLEVSDEVCDGIDNDCDGDVDDDDDDFVAPLCQRTAGVCEGLQSSCVGGVAQECSDEDFTSHASNNDQRYQLVETLCDEQDNNCDGQIDERCCADGQETFNLLNSASGPFRIGSLATNSDKSLAALTFQRGQAIGVLFVDDTMVPTFTNQTLANTEPDAPLTHHWSESRQEFCVIYAAEEVLRLTFINVDGQISNDFAVTIDTELVEIQSAEADNGNVVVLGLSNDGEVVALLINSENGLLEGMRTYRPDNTFVLDSLSNITPVTPERFEFALSYREPGPFETRGTHRILWMDVIARPNDVGFNERQFIERPVLNFAGAQSSRTFVADGRIYHITQDRPTLLNLGFTVPNTPTAFFQLFALPNDDRVTGLTMRHATRNEQFTFINVDRSGEDFVGSFLFDNEVNARQSLNADILRTEHTKSAVPLTNGLLIIVSSSPTPDTGTLSAFIVNQEGDFLCPNQ